MQRISGLPLLFSFLLCMQSTGCVTWQLQHNTLRQAKTLPVLYETQVLDNLAMFTVNPNSTPYFAVAGTGTNQVTDQDTMKMNAGVFTLRFWKFLDFQAQRSMMESWSVQPVTDPGRLMLMQCAYKRAVGAATLDPCQNCCEIERAWYGDKYDCDNPCGITAGWLCHSNRWKDVPKCCCNHYGYYCGTYVWVDPCQRYEFSKLVMRILDYAQGTKFAKPAGSTKEVRYYFNANGSQGTIQDHHFSVVANVGANKSFDEIQSDLKIDELSLSQIDDHISQLEILQQQGDVNQMVDALNEAAKTYSALSPKRNLPMDDMSTDKAKKHVVEALDSLRLERNRMMDRMSNAQSFQADPAGPNTPRDFGPPTQFNNLYGPNLLLLQQQLNTVTPPRN